MKIQSIRLKNFLSFGDKVQEIKFSDYITIVGPNDSGKTTVYRAIEYLGQLLRQNLAVSDEYYYNRNYERPFEIEIGLEFDSDELDAIRNFIVCSCYESVNVTTQGDNQQNLTQLTQNVTKRLANSIFSDFFHEMSIIVKSVNRRNFADILFKFSKNGRELYYYNYSFTRDLNPRGSRTLGRLQDLVFQKLRNEYPDLVTSYNRGDLVQIPSSIEHFIPSLFDFLYEALPEGSSHSIAINGFHLSQLLNAYQTFPEILHLQEFANKHGYNPQEGIGLSQLLSTIYSDSIVKTSDMRGRPQASQNFIDSEHVDVITNLNGENLPLFLFQLRNSNDPRVRKRYNKILEDFKEITGGLEFDIVIREKKIIAGQESEIGIMPSQQPEFRTDNLHPLGIRTKDTEIVKHELIIQVVKNDIPIPIELTAAGRFETLILLTAISGQENKIILLDEPAINLHPISQRRIVQLIQDAISKNHNQIVTITHSPYLVNPEHLHDVWKFTPTNDGTVIINLEEATKNLKNDEEKKIIQQFRNSDIRSILFQKGVILVEGPSDKIVLEKVDRFLAENESSTNIEENEWSIIDVGGKNSTIMFVNLLARLNVPYLVILDYDTLMRCENKIKTNNTEVLTSSVPYYIHQTAGLTPKELEPLKELQKSVQKHKITKQNETKEELWYDPVNLPLLAEMAKSHNIIVLTKDLEGVLQRPVTTKDRKPLKALDAVNELISKNLVPEELRSIIHFTRKFITSSK